MNDLGRAVRWTVEGWRQWDWQLVNAVESQAPRRPDVGSIPLDRPVTVRTALTDAGAIEPPYHRHASRTSEWIENRHWIYRCDLRRLRDTEASTHGVGIVFECLDHAGLISLDDEVVKLALQFYILVIEKR